MNTIKINCTYFDDDAEAPGPKKLICVFDMVLCCVPQAVCVLQWCYAVTMHVIALFFLILRHRDGVSASESVSSDGQMLQQCAVEFLVLPAASGDWQTVHSFLSFGLVS